MTATLKEPTLLPTTFPNILVNANQGIAVAWQATFAALILKRFVKRL
jgi:DNA gyrase subunit A